MPDHYYSESPSAAHDIRSFTLAFGERTLRFKSDAGVFSKGHLDKGTALLISALPGSVEGRALDLGCGWGAVGVWMAAHWPDADVTLSDINERALFLARENLAVNGLTGGAVRSDGFSGLSGPFRLIATNPPIRTGKENVYRLLREAADHLSPGGTLYVVMRRQQGADSAQRYLQTLFPTVEIAARGGGFRVFACTK